MDSYSVFLKRASNIPDYGFQFTDSILSTFSYFVHSVSSTFYSKSSCLIISHKIFEKRGQLHDFFRTCFKHPGLGFPIQGFNFNHFFTVLYTPFIRNSILNHHAKSFPTKVLKTWTVTRSFQNVLQTSRIRVSNIRIRF